MDQNLLMNSEWMQLKNQLPTSFKTLQHIHFDQCFIHGARVGSLHLLLGDRERISYTQSLNLTGFSSLTMGLNIRGNEVNEFFYQVIFVNKEDEIIKVNNHNVASEITTQFKNIRVTYKIPALASAAWISFEIRGIATGVTVYRPSLYLK